MQFDPIDNDSFCDSLLSNSKDLFEWLGSDDGVERTLGEMQSQLEGEGFAAELNQNGALRVWAIDIEEDDKSGNTGTLVIELPANPEERECLLEIGNQVANEQGFDSIPDMGQKYLFIKLD